MIATRLRRRPPHAGWPEWRRSRTRPALRPTCATCWGQGRIWEPGPLGLMPVVCPECQNAR